MTTTLLTRRRVSPVALPTLLLGVFLVPISIAGVATALPSIARDLGSDPVQLQWVVNGFNATFAVFTLVWGVISDHVGYKITWLIGVTGSIAALLFCAVTPDLALLDLGRILAGLFAAAIGTSTPAIISGAYEGVARTRGFALFGTALGLGLAIGPSISGGLTAAFGWRGVFVAFAVLIAVSLVLSGFVPAVRHERDPGAKIIDFRLLRNPRFLSAVLMPVIQAFGYITLLTYLPVALSSVYGLTAGQLALVMIGLTLGALVGPVVGVRLVNSGRGISVHAMFYTSIALMLLGNAGMLLIAAAVPLWVLLIPMALLGLSFGLPLGLIDGAAMAAVPPTSSGSASGLVQFARLGSEAIVIGFYAAIISALVATRVADPRLAQEVASGLPGHAADYIPAFVIGQIAILVAVVLGLIATIVLHRVVRRSERRPGDAPRRVSATLD
ncbi:MFS transporter [Microlunatus endophyticus]|uniref:MFS transporter n=1 Tax=Microlunatus endophyticus TaxID=1716077 RepID=A0A917W790_9ACTN|nr:MFS transporter [Microlunatus endophyticus]GGL71790.1 MFS transporter [Microlunatus endophyticus]